MQVSRLHCTKHHLCTRGNALSSRFCDSEPFSYGSISLLLPFLPISQFLLSISFQYSHCLWCEISFSVYCHSYFDIFWYPNVSQLPSDKDWIFFHSVFGFDKPPSPSIFPSDSVAICHVSVALSLCKASREVFSHASHGKKGRMFQAFIGQKW